MPATERPGRAKYRTATKTVQHGFPCIEANTAGRAIKQKAAKWSDGFTATPTIAIGELFVIRDKGTHEFANTGISGGGVGDAVYIATADNTLSLTAGSGKVPFGRIAEIPGVAGRSVPTGRVRIDLDEKDSI